MKLIAIILTIFLPINCLGQKFMVEYGDTMKYEPRMEIIEGDTVYHGSCNTFLKQGNKIINVQVACLPRGYWEIEKGDGTILKGHYTLSGKLTGTWKTFNSKGQLIKVKDYTLIGDENYVLREIHYKEGKAIIISEKTWFAKFYLKNVLLISLILGFLFFSRVFINSPIYNRQNGTHYSPIYIFAGPNFTPNYKHSIRCTFKFWWSLNKLKKENWALARWSNTFSIMVLGMFMGIIIGLGASGEII